MSKALKTEAEKATKALDLEALSAITEEIVEVGEQEITVTMLVPEDVEKCRKLILAKQLPEGLAMEYLTFLAVRKKHTEIRWYNFQRFNFRTVNRLMAVMAVMNGFDETFQTFGGTSGSGPDGRNGASTGAEIDPEVGLDFD